MFFMFFIHVQEFFFVGECCASCTGFCFVFLFFLMLCSDASFLSFLTIFFLVGPFSACLSIVVCHGSIDSA